jgi:citronellol/citronellal dehydrogenase
LSAAGATSGEPAAADLRGRAAVMPGGSRGIALAIALEVARGDGQVVQLAKTDTHDPLVPGSLARVVAETRTVGGVRVSLAGDVRNDEDVAGAMATAVDLLGDIDSIGNNAWVPDLSATGQARMNPRSPWRW